MSLAFRIIPRLDIKGSNLVKGVHLEGLRVLGKPEIFAEYFYKEGADEIFYQDVVASLFGRNSLYEIISKTVKNIFIPLTVGGGIRTNKDIEKILKSGADRVSINSAALENPKLIQEAVKTFGSSTIVITIEAIKQQNGKYFAFKNNGRENTNIDVIDWSKKVEDLGAGEILLTSVDHEGTGNGMNIDLLEKVTQVVSIPIICHGGAGATSDVIDVAKKKSANGVALSSIFHYEFLSKKKNRVTEINSGNIEYLNSEKIPTNIKPSTIKNLKEHLSKNKIVCSRNHFLDI
jgi:cyclase